MKIKILAVFLLLLSIFSSISLGQSKYLNSRDYYKQLEERRQNILHAMTGMTWMDGYDHRLRIYLGITKLATGVDEKVGLKFLWDAVNDSVHWGSFNVYSTMEAILRLGDKLPAEFVEKAKYRLASKFGEDKGFTENHKLQYRTARYFYGQTWPNGPTLADGMTPLEAKQEGEDWIYDFIERTVTVGQLEYDSVNYHQMYLLCFATLYDFAEDLLMRRKAWMMMQLLLADWAPEYLKGNWIGAHSREKYNQVLHTVLNCGVAIPLGYLFFGDSYFHPELPETYYVSLVAVQGFRPLPILGDIATDRSKAYIHKETKAPRRGFGINTSDLPTRKYSYVTKDYALGSSFGDITAVENHRWDLTWISEKDGSTCFFINPSFSKKQLLKYFDDDPDKILDNIIRQRPYYKDPNKWIEGSPFEEVIQHENTLIALYDIPKDEKNQHVNGFFSKNIEERIAENGWIFCSSDSVYFAVKTFTKGKWHEEKDHFRLALNNPKTGVIMEVAQKKEFPSFAAFQNKIKSNSLKIDLKKLQVNYTNFRGAQLEFTYPDQRFVNGEKIIFENWPLFGGPFVNSKVGSKIITIQYGKEKVILDFNDYSVRFEMID